LDSLFNLKDKVAIVTGAGSGLGKAMAIALAKAGANIIAADINVSSAEETVRELKQKGFPIKVDVTNSEEVNKMTEKVINEFGKVNILVNSAGIARRIPVEKMDEKEWDEVIKVNLKGTFLCVQCVGRKMIEQKKGKIINIASVSGSVANKDLIGLAAYCASKAGVILLTKVLAVEWAKHNINVNCISPGYMKTPMTAKTRTDQKLYKTLLDTVPFGRFGEANELAGAVVFLASDASSYITGSNLSIDGGYTAW